MMIHLHSQNVASSELELQARLQTHKDLLLLFLEHFAAIRHLPCSLISNYDLRMKGSAI
jgi:hypothetical protein